jgi:hypothetical protein
MGEDVTALDGLGGRAATAMQPRAHLAGERDDRGHSFHIRRVRVSNDCFGHNIRTSQGLPKKRFCTGPIAFVTEEHVNKLPVLIDRAIEIEFLLAAKAKYVVDRPCARDSPAVFTKGNGQLRAKRLHPGEYRACSDSNMTLG